MSRLQRPTSGVLAGWQSYRTATPLSYRNPIFHGIRSAAVCTPRMNGVIVGGSESHRPVAQLQARYLPFIAFDRSSVADLGDLSTAFRHLRQPQTASPA